MKNNGRQRFYLWDYLWWMGEKLEQARRTGRVDAHYAKCRFNELLAVLLFFLAIAIICFMMYLLDKK